MYFVYTFNGEQQIYIIYNDDWPTHEHVLKGNYHVVIFQVELLLHEYIPN